MTEIFGDYQDNLPSTAEYLVIGFSPNSIPLKHRWKTNGLSADFIADYLQTFFVGADPTNSSSAPVPVHSKNAVKYVANELLENAMKFHYEKSPFQTKIAFTLRSDQLIFQVTNSLSPDRVESFKKYIKYLLSDDPNELYIAQMEANASDEDGTHSGLGFLSMLCDYSAKLGWMFEVQDGDPPTHLVTTMVTLDV